MAKDRIEHEGHGTGQAEAGLRNHDEEGHSEHGGCFYSNRLSSSTGVPMAQGNGSMDWAKVNHAGFYVGDVVTQEQDPGGAK